MKRIVVSNRGEDSLAVYDFDGATGRLAFKARTFLVGKWPRDFIFVSDNLALVALERSGEVHMLCYDVATADFKTIATLGGLFRPVSLCKCPPETRDFLGMDPCGGGDFGLETAQYCKTTEKK